MKIQSIDLFCGTGGLTYGLRKAGIDVLAGLDSDSTCQYAYEANNKSVFINSDISTYQGSKLAALYGSDAIRVLAGCAPCQTFSKHTQKNKNRENDQKWNLLYQFSTKIQDINPDIVSMENVPGLAKYQVFKDFLTTLAAMEYQVSYKVVACEKYGIPQTRRRLVLLASKLGKIELIPYTHPNREDYVTVGDVLGESAKCHLPKINHGESDLSDRLHKSATLSKLNLKRIQSSRPGGTWSDWDETLLPECYKKDSGKTYSSVYGRMSWGKPAPTITTQFYVYGTGRFGHPEQDRAISLREGALLQTFPKTYKMVPPRKNVSVKILGRHIGNAVPVRLGEVIGESILKHAKEYYDQKDRGE